ncbi:MAG: MBL fold metallo-hydrolase [Phycisphaerae bacterium]
MTTDLNIATFVDPQFGENAYVVSCREGGPCWIIDPGLPPSAKEILTHIDAHGLQPAALVLTHGHLDHIAGVPDVLKAHDALPIYMAEAAQPALTDPSANLSVETGMPVVVGRFEAHDLPADGTLPLDGTTWRVFDTSGHAPGSRSLYCAEAGVVFVGDALFAGSIGRTDFHHSEPGVFIRNIRERLLTLPEATRVYSGHGPVTTIGAERRTNPFLQG